MQQSSEFLGISKDIKFLEMSDLLRTFSNRGSSSSSGGELPGEMDGTDESGINALNLSMVQL